MSLFIEIFGEFHISKVKQIKMLRIGIGLVHAEDAYEDLVELMPLYRGQNAIYNGLDSIETDYLVRLLKVHSNVRILGRNNFLKIFLPWLKHMRMV
jgi:hypothetical protein